MTMDDFSDLDDDSNDEYDGDFITVQEVDAIVSDTAAM
jgi:hypothetical protein